MLCSIWLNLSIQTVGTSMLLLLFVAVKSQTNASYIGSHTCPSCNRSTTFFYRWGGLLQVMNFSFFFLSILLFIRYLNRSLLFLICQLCSSYCWFGFTRGLHRIRKSWGVYGRVWGYPSNFGANPGFSFFLLGPCQGLGLTQRFEFIWCCLVLKCLVSVLFLRL